MLDQRKGRPANIIDRQVSITVGLYKFPECHYYTEVIIILSTNQNVLKIKSRGLRGFSRYPRNKPITVSEFISWGIERQLYNHDYCSQLFPVWLFVRFCVATSVNFHRALPTIMSAIFVNPFNAGIVFIRQNLTYIGVRFWHIKTVPELKEFMAVDL